MCGTLPWFRYDRLIPLSWKKFLPLSLNNLIFFVGVWPDISMEPAVSMFTVAEFGSFTLKLEAKY